jgi:urea transport system permease protein
VLERTIIRFLYGRPLETLLATFGVSLLLQQFVARSSREQPHRRDAAWMSGTLQINDALGITYNRLYIVLSRRRVRAAAGAPAHRVWPRHPGVSPESRDGARHGHPSQWVDAMTFGLGAGIAGVAGVALSQLTNVGQTWVSRTSSTRSWSWSSAASETCGARSSAGCRSASSTSCSNRTPARCSARSSCSSR